MNASRVLSSHYVNAVIAPGDTSIPQSVDTFVFHAAYDSVQEDLLLKTPKNVGVMLTEQL